MELGAYIAHTRIKVKVVVRRALIFGAALLVLVVLGVIASERASPLVWIIAGMWGLVALVVLVRLLLAVRAYAAGGRIVIYEHGVKWQRPSKTDGWRWEQFTGLEGGTEPIRSGLKITGYTWHFEIDGREPLRVSPFYERANDINALIADKITRAHLKRILFNIMRGNTVAFGCVDAARSGLTIGEMQIAWRHLHDARVEGSKFQINFLNHELQPRQLIVPHAEIDNLPVLIALITRAVHATMVNATRPVDDKPEGFVESLGDASAEAG